MHGIINSTFCKILSYNLFFSIILTSAVPCDQSINLTLRVVHIKIFLTFKWNRKVYFYQMMFLRVILLQRFFVYNECNKREIIFCKYLYNQYFFRLEVDDKMKQIVTKLARTIAIGTAEFLLIFLWYANTTSVPYMCV